MTEAPPGAVHAETVERMAAAMLIVVRDHLAAPPPDPGRVLESLNALACVAAVLIVGTGNAAGRRASRAFLQRAVAAQVAALLREAAHDGDAPCNRRTDS